MVMSVVKASALTNALPSAILDPSKNDFLGTWLTVYSNKDSRLLLDGREVERKTNESIFLPLGAHLLKVEAMTSRSNAGAKITLDPDWGVGAWIWDYKTYDKQKVRLWRSVLIPPNTTVAQAKLDITADNGYQLFLDGREIGEGSDLRHITEYDVTSLLLPGPHVLAVEAFNDDKEAGVLAGLKVIFTTGGVMATPTDTSWRIVPADESSWKNLPQARETWPHARIIGRFKESPWAYLPAGFSRLPPVQPLHLFLWQRGWFQAGLLCGCGVVLLVCLQLMIRLTMQSKARELLQRERSRVARDIHDELGAGLTQVLLLGEVARKEVQPPPAGESGIERLCVKVRELSTTVDEIVWAVNSRHDTVQDFARHVCKYAQAFFASSAILCRLDVASEIPALPFDLPVRRNLFLAVKEALNNAAKHSAATELFLRIHLEPGLLIVTVEDNGRGFAPSLATGERNGLTNLRQRLAEIEGTCEVLSQPGAGCRVVMRVSTARSRPGMIPWFRLKIKGPPLKVRGPLPDPIRPA